MLRKVLCQTLRLSKEPRTMDRASFTIEAMIRGYRDKLGVRSSWLCGSLRTEIGTLLNHRAGIFNSSRRDRTGHRAVRTRNLRDLLLRDEVPSLNCHSRSTYFLDTCVQNKFLIFASGMLSNYVKICNIRNFLLYCSKNANSKRE